MTTTPPRTSPALAGTLARLEGARALDGAVGAGLRALAPLGRAPALDAALRGRWLGHAAHPMLTDIPIGSWTSANLVDVVGGRRGRPFATGLLAVGCASAVPAIATGLAEWRTASREDLRTGLVHAALNAAALGLYSASLACRLRRRHGTGVALAAAGTAVATAGGYLGGHMAIGRKVGTVWT
ncbi:MAG TPA: DUF2231 domain-containing protein [Miltoncostaeaceae bacterium]|nr:DUF2231 domain-containing protein [Miltoncostaeaceae bacterium]